ncbi:phosphate regulon transcriptional regulator PhoB [Neisseria animalis]|uniref:Phosphate regulon transcriptional regulatory protein PhoB n=1 Tax=Neisseria animalis TaxID=492 RepID=A0A5P3MSK8_NEIAN|nr:phosphate regulon transcriptional regulator PhoB [Neisseria animalis]QEY24593.1 phosphate regulon transcriptional regulatory protein PhoB [Neisseria animalis]ROW32994.1 phosphate regulon transcriptional regulatory protein PhoB [Neisseria animalis]VEE07439.1 two-component system transcriptional response regulator [Neisseria animalis]
MSAYILIVEDEPSIATLIRFNLEAAGYRTATAENTAEADRLLKNELPDLVLLDYMLPDISGIDYIRTLRGQSRTRNLPVIMLTARSEESDKELGLNSGADDYITKPFSPRELIARINALLRRAAPQKSRQIIESHGIRLDAENRKAATADGIELSLNPTEFKILHFFMAHPDRLYSRSQLLDFIWGDHVFIEERTVDVHIRRLRQGLDKANLAHLVQTVRGSGYRFGSE